MRRSVSVAISGAMLAVFAATATAQPPVKIAPGQRVRLTTETGTQIGTVAAVTTDNLRLTDGAQERTVAMAGVRRIDVSSGSSRGASAKKGAIRGAIISGAIGALLLPLQRGETGSSVGESVALGAWSGGLFGGLIGAGVGAARAGERWETVWP